MISSITNSTTYILYIYMMFRECHNIHSTQFFLWRICNVAIKNFYYIYKFYLEVSVCRVCDLIAIQDWISTKEILLKVQSCKLCNNKYIIASTQIINTDFFAFIAALVFKLLSSKVLFINRKIFLDKKVKILEKYQKRYFIKHVPSKGNTSQPTFPMFMQQLPHKTNIN